MPSYEYPVRVRWHGGRDGKGSVRADHSGTEVGIAVPEEFQGPGGGSCPEELLSAAVASCYTMTLGIILANRKIGTRELDVEAVGTVEGTGAALTYTAVTIRPKVVLEPDATDEQVSAATDLAMKADGYCIITNAVRGKVEVKVEPTVVKA